MTFTLLADGTSDAVLMDLLAWSLRRHGVARLEGQCADRYRIPRTSDQNATLRMVLDLYPCDVLFIHRDAEAQDPALRREQIREWLLLSMSLIYPSYPSE